MKLLVCLLLASSVASCSIRTNEQPATSPAKVVPSAVCKPKPKSEVECSGKGKLVVKPVPYSKPVK